MTGAAVSTGGATWRLPVYGVRLVRERWLKVPAPVEDAPPRIAGPRDVYEIVRRHLGDPPQEHFVALLLDTQHAVRGVHTVTVGILDASIVHPRETFRAAILANSAAVVIAHNHPSGDPTPSPEDREVTRQLVEAGRIIGIPVLDHVVIGDGRYLSFVEAGLLGSSSAAT